MSDGTEHAALGRERIRLTQGEALLDAAKEAEARGDIGKDGGPEVWDWLRLRAARIKGVL